MSSLNNQKQFYSNRLVGLDNYFDDMAMLFEAKKFPKVLLLNGKKGIGKFTLTMHLINYIFTKKETIPYNAKEKTINLDSFFYNSLLNKTTQDVILIQAEENKNIKIDDIRSLKSVLSNSSLSENPRFIIIDDVEFLNINSANALLKTLEEPSDNNFFILINNQQADLIETISSRCLKTNIFLNSIKRNEVIDYLIKFREVKNLIEFNKKNLSPGQFMSFNSLYLKYKINKKDNILTKLSTLISGYKKDKDKISIGLIYYLIDLSFLDKIQKNQSKTEFLLDTKASIINIVNDFVQYNLNINAVLSTIRIKLNNV